MLTLRGYALPKSEINTGEVKATLTVRPYVPTVFVNPKFVTKYPMYTEDEKYLYVPKYFGIDRYGPPKSSQREVNQTPVQHWKFAGTLRPQQVEVTNSFLTPQPHDGVICLHTGGGKTVCALYIASILQYPTLILVHNTFLRDQWIERIKQYIPNARIGRVQADVCEVENKDVVICMLQTLSMKDFHPNTFAPIGFVIVDECHHIASEVFSQAIPKITSKYMLGLSATPERKDKLMHVINWLLGPMLYQSGNDDSEDPAVRVEVFEYKNDDPNFNEIIYNRQGVMFTTLMVNKLAECDDRTRWLTEILVDVLEVETDRQILVLSDRVEHCKALLARLPTELREQACILAQNVKSDVRAQYTETKKILIATYAMCKEGFDVPSLNTLMMATPRPDIDQIVGRILRVEKSKRKIHPLILDIVDPQFRRQFQQRNSLYNKRQYNVQITEI